MLTKPIAAVLLASLAGAHPGVLDSRAVCNADNCLRAVRGTRGKPGPSQASQDCSSYFQSTATVTQAGGVETITVTSTSTVTDDPFTSPVTAITEKPHTVYTHQPITGSSIGAGYPTFTPSVSSDTGVSVGPEYPTFTPGSSSDTGISIGPEYPTYSPGASSQTPYTGPVSLNTTFAAGTLHTGPVTLSTSMHETSPSNGPVTARNTFNERDNAAQTSLPTYISSACGADLLRYSSACSCASFIPTPTTKTVVATASQTTVTSVVTQTVEPVYCIAFNVKATTGPFAGYYIQRTADDAEFPGRAIYGTKYPKNATDFTLLDDGRIALLEDHTMQWASFSGGIWNVYVQNNSGWGYPAYEPGQVQDPYEMHALFCKIPVVDHAWQGPLGCVGVSNDVSYSPEIFQSWGSDIYMNVDGYIHTDRHGVDCGLVAVPAAACMGQPAKN